MQADALLTVAFAGNTYTTADTDEISKRFLVCLHAEDAMDPLRPGAGS